MKKIIIQAVIFVLMASCIPASAKDGDAAGTAVKAVDEKETAVSNSDLFYAIGILFGANLKDMDISGVDYDSMNKGMKDFQSGSSSKMNRDQAMTLVKKVLLQKQKKAGEENAAREKDFLQSNSGKAGVRTTSSGLQYEVIREGSGKKPAETDRVKVHYKGTLLDGRTFDSSIDRGEPSVFRLNEVIPGWTEALQLMTTGSKYRFFVPSKLAYGPQANGMITPNSLLIFEIELLSIEQ